MSEPGKFYVLDGPDGCGKSTQAARLTEALRAEGRSVRHLREPGGTALGEGIRALLLDPARTAGEAVDVRVEVLLFFASRLHMVETIVRPALAAGETIVCERFVSSTYAYQACASRLGAELVLDLADRVLPQVFPPDHCFLLDIDPGTALARAMAAGRGADRIEARGLAYHEGVREGFLRYAERFAHSTTVLDVEGLAVDEVAARLRAAVSAVEGRS